MPIEFIDHNKNDELYAKKLENCSFRSKDVIEKPACCSSGKTIGFACLKKQIFPVSFTMHCADCTDFVSIIKN